MAQKIWITRMTDVNAGGVIGMATRDGGGGMEKHVPKARKHYNKTQRAGNTNMLPEVSEHSRPISRA